MRIHRGVALGTLLLVGSGCGGGGGGGGTAPPPTTAVPTAVATATSVATATTTTVPTRTPTQALPSPTVPPSATVAPQASATPTNTLAPPTSTPSTVPTPEPTSTPTATPLTGPLVSAFGLADTNGTFDVPAGRDALGRPLFGRQFGSGFLLFVEGRPGPSGLPVATNLVSSVAGLPTGRPDLQVLVSRDLGDGSADVCDKAFPETGVVPAVDPPSFALEQEVSDALNDLACRFRLYTEPGFACTQDNNGNFLFASPGSTLQFCTLVNDAFPFPAGETVVTARVRDTAGNVGPATEIVVRITGR